VDVDDVRVVDPVRGPRLAQHPRAEVRLAPKVRANQLHRYDAIDEYVTGAIDHAHPALADPGFESIPTRDRAAKHRIRRLRRLRKSLCALHSPPLSTCEAEGSGNGTAHERDLGIQNVTWSIGMRYSVALCIPY
jgi:hypothetical protein